MILDFQVKLLVFPMVVWSMIMISYEATRETFTTRNASKLDHARLSNCPQRFSVRRWKEKGCFSEISSLTMTLTSHELQVRWKLSYRLLDVCQSDRSWYSHLDIWCAVSCVDKTETSGQSLNLPTLNMRLKIKINSENRSGLTKLK